MTDRYFALTVVLTEDIREDDAQPIIDAIMQIRGVLSVKSHVSNLESLMAEERAKSHIRNQIWELLQ